MKTKTYGQLLIAATMLGLLGLGCSHATIDPSNPDYTVADSNGQCGPSTTAKSDGNTTDSRKPSSITQDGKTYCFSSESARDRFFEAHAINSRY